MIRMDSYHSQEALTFKIDPVISIQLIHAFLTIVVLIILFTNIYNSCFIFLSLFLSYLQILNPNYRISNHPNKLQRSSLSTFIFSHLQVKDITFSLYSLFLSVYFQFYRFNWSTLFYNHKGTVKMLVILLLLFSLKGGSSVLRLGHLNFQPTSLTMSQVPRAPPPSPLQKKKPLLPPLID